LNDEIKKIKILQKCQGKKSEIQRMRIKLKTIIFSKLGLKNEIKNK
jgi:hypothetical protein